MMPVPSSSRLPSRMLPLLLGSLLALTTAPLQGQETATLRGRVIDDETGEPIASANVRVGGAPALTTDSAGCQQ